MNPFFQYGDGNWRGLSENNDFLIFYSESMIRNLLSNDVWCVDGTFDVVPKPYFQLFTISYLNESHVFPAIFCILKTKNLRHIAMFSQL